MLLLSETTLELNGADLRIAKSMSTSICLKFLIRTTSKTSKQQQHK